MSPRSLVTVVGKGICLALLVATPGDSPAAMAGVVTRDLGFERLVPGGRGLADDCSNRSESKGAIHTKGVDFEHEAPSAATRAKADWVLDSGDNRGLPFVIVDKIDAKVFVFKVDGRLLGAAPVLLGLAPGDKAVPGIGNRALASIRPEERITPAGRFVAGLDRNLRGVEVLWIDYDAALSLHRVVVGTRQERRAERLATPTQLDNRISYGCINVPVEFYNEVVSPAFKGTEGIVYVLPETLVLPPVKSLK